MDKEKLLEIIQNDLDAAQFCADKDWEFNSGGNGINPCEAAATLRGLAKAINAEAGEELISLDYDEEEMKELYRGYGYDVDDEDEEDE